MATTALYIILIYSLFASIRADVLIQLNNQTSIELEAVQVIYKGQST